MTLPEISQTIIDSDPRAHWERIEHHKGMARAVFKADVNLRIESHIDDDVKREDFQEEWATKHPDSKAFSRNYNIYYNATLVGFVTLVWVDGHRAILPLPDRTTMTPKRLAFRIAQIFDELRTLDEYMSRAGLNYPDAK